MTNEEMLDRLHTEICEVTFTKNDGSDRVMICTLKTDFLPHVPAGADLSEGRKFNDMITVWDIEEDAWRAFKPSRVTKFESSPE